MAKIFISYRREDSEHIAGMIDQRLRSLMPEHEFFFDVDSIPLGRDFRKDLEESVANCDYLLAIIGKQWLTVCDENGDRRLDDPSDWVRIEIESALNRNIPVIPVLLSLGAHPKPDQLPASLKNLSYRQNVKVRPLPDFDRDVESLARKIEKQIFQRMEEESQQRTEIVHASRETVRLETERHTQEAQAKADRELLKTREIERLEPESRQRCEAERALLEAEPKRRAKDAPDVKQPGSDLTEMNRVPAATGPVEIDFLWPKNWSLLDPGASSKIRWSMHPNLDVDRIELELLLDGKRFEVIHHSDDAEPSFVREFHWKVSRAIPQHQNWQIKLRIRDQLGRTSEGTSEFFRSAATRQTRRIGAVIGFLFSLGFCIYVTLNEPTTVKDFLVGMSLLGPLTAVLGWGAAFYSPLRAIIPVCLIVAAGFGVLLAPEPTYANRTSCGLAAAYIFALIGLIPLFQCWQNVTGRDVIRM